MTEHIPHVDDKTIRRIKEMQQKIKQYRPLWDINPIEVSCSIEECADMFARLNEYLLLTEQPFTPQLLLQARRITLLEYVLFDYKHQKVASVEIAKSRDGCRINFDLYQRDESSLFRGIYRVTRNHFLQ